MISPFLIRKAERIGRFKSHVDMYIYAFRSNILIVIYSGIMLTPACREQMDCMVD